MNSNKRIAKNTAFLYFRMLILMFVSLYTTRVVLRVLGNEDFGLFNVVGSVIVMFSFLNSALSSATQRFLACSLGSSEQGNYKELFQNCITIHGIIALIILLLAETVGLWFVNHKLNIPLGRSGAMNFVYQCSVFLFLIQIMQAPYQASIVAHEQMNFYSVVGILEAVLRLFLVLVLQVVLYDRLKAYAILLVLNGMIVFVVNLMYCQRNFSGCRFGFLYSKEIFVRLLSFSGWYLFGSIAYLSMIQGANILINMFWGVGINAAIAVALQVNAAVGLFVSNFRQAVDPQIYKSFAQNDTDRLHSLVFGSARSTFYLLLLLCTPLIFNMDYILHLWLKSPPEKSVYFCQLALLFTLIQSFDSSFGSIFRATGRIRENQLLCTAVYMLVLPVVYVLFKNHFAVESLYYTKIIAAIIVSFIVKIFLLKFQLKISFSCYCKRLLAPIFRVSILPLIVLVAIFWLQISDPLLKFVTILFANSIALILSVFYLDMDEMTRKKAFVMVKGKIASLKG